MLKPANRRYWDRNGMIPRTGHSRLTRCLETSALAAAVQAALIAAILMFAVPVAAAPLFEDHAVLQVKLRGPLVDVFSDTRNRRERDFTLTAEGREHSIEVRLRGNSRLRVCDFPPLRLNFSRKDTPGSVFEGQDKLKLVTHCRNSDQGEQNVLEEYAAYRILNTLTELSYRVRLLRIEYEDSDGRLNDRATPRYGFVLEPGAQMGDRTGARTVTLPGVPVKRHDREQAALVYVFQYLIGNTDWGLVKADYDEGCCHNVDLFELDSEVYFVPYDFDLAGIVSASYAYPDRTLGIQRVTQRLYRGVCTDRALLSSAIDTIVARQSNLLDLIEEMPGLTAKSRDKATKFLQRFFDEAGKKDKLLREFERHCIG